MKSTISTKAPLSVATPLLAVVVTQGFAPLQDATLERAVASGDYKGKKDETLLVYGSEQGPERILLVGVGKAGEITRSSIDLDGTTAIVTIPDRTTTAELRRIYDGAQITHEDSRDPMWGHDSLPSVWVCLSTSTPRHRKTRTRC